MHWTFYTSLVSAILNAYLAIVSPELRLAEPRLPLLLYT
jgi:hypothetical protein